MSICGNDSPRNAVYTWWKHAERRDQDMRIAWIRSGSQPHHRPVGLRHVDLTQLGDNRLTEHQMNGVGRSGEACVGGGRGADKPGVQRCGDRGLRRYRDPELTEKKGRPH